MGELRFAVAIPEGPVLQQGTSTDIRFPQCSGGVYFEGVIVFRWLIRKSGHMSNCMPIGEFCGGARGQLVRFLYRFALSFNSPFLGS